MKWDNGIVKLTSSFENDEDFSFGSIIDVDYTEYAAKEIHFHTPSEHYHMGK